MGKWMIQHDRNACLGCGSCTAFCPDHWEMDKDGKARLIDGSLNKKTNMEEKLVDESEAEANKQAAMSCPANCIKVVQK